MNFQLSIISTIIIVLVLIMIYRNRAEDEQYLGLKLVGYYLLGTFNFNFNGIVIPLGIVVYLLAFHPKINTKAKRFAALLGFIMMVIGHLFRMI